MHRFIIILALVALPLSQLHAGRIFGDLKIGAYRLNVKEEGKCILTVHIDKQMPTLEVFSYANATRYDILLEKDKDGKYALKRK